MTKKKKNKLNYPDSWKPESSCMCPAVILSQDQSCHLTTLRDTSYLSKTGAATILHV